MGALAGNRKRGEEYEDDYGTEFHVWKKPKIFRPNPNTTILKYSQYPEPKNSFKREVHAPVRRHRGGFSVNLRNWGSKVSYRDSSAEGMGNFLSRRYEITKRSAFDTSMIAEDNKEEVQEVFEDSSIEEVEILENRRDQKWKETNGVVGDSNMGEVEILEDRKDQKWKESNGVVEDLQKFDGMVVDKDSRLSSSSGMTNVSDGNFKVETTEKLLESLLLSAEFGVPQESVYKKLLYIAERRNEKLRSLKFEIDLAEKHRQIQQLLRPQKKEEAVKKDATGEAFKPLTKEEEVQVAHALSNSSRRKLLVTHEISNISITGEVLQCLRPRAWLNDEVINLYLELIKEREKREPQKFLNCHFFNTFFFKKLVSGKGGYNYQSVRRWTSQKKLGYCIIDCDKIFVPIHKEVHWCLAVINKKDKKFQYLDSLGGGDSQVMKVLASYIVDEVKDKSGKEIDVSSWQQEFVADLPEQENGFDCGVFMIKYIDFYSRDIGLCFNQEHMPYFRLRTAKEILSYKAGLFVGLSLEACGPDAGLPLQVTAHGVGVRDDILPSLFEWASLLLNLSLYNLSYNKGHEWLNMANDHITPPYATAAAGKFEDLLLLIQVHNATQ
ncbi:hypothetical protein ACH5RR_033486 [Cinchona calisaya]|uniref:Ubiquitin-like protease family profile domain-containing protein n=1 Tax=Cinchona calisaya TaxID=153742 RepID=A0ABD2YQ40_9GENT